MLIFVTKKSYRILLFFHLRLAFLNYFEYTLSLIFLNPSALRKIIYISVSLCRLKCCLAWQKLANLAAPYTPLNKEEYKMLCNLNNSIDLDFEFKIFYYEIQRNVRHCSLYRNHSVKYSCLIQFGRTVSGTIYMIEY